MKHQIVSAKTREAILASVTVMLAPLAINQANINNALDAFFDEIEGRSATMLTNRQPIDRVISRKQAAKIINCSVAAVTRKAKNGKLKAVYGGENSKRLTGISEKSIRDYIEGMAE